MAGGRGTTAMLPEWAAGFRLQDAHGEVIVRMQALVLELMRVVAVGAHLPWSRASPKALGMRFIVRDAWLEDD